MYIITGSYIYTVYIYIYIYTRIIYVIYLSDLSLSLQVSGASVEETLEGEVVMSVIKVTVTRPALYTCLATNRHASGANTAKVTAKVTVTGI